jgi:hypothetical protein
VVSLCAVELRRLEALTLCLQSMAKVSSTVCGLGQSAARVHLSPAPSRSVGVGCGCRGALLRSCEASPPACLPGRALIAVAQTGVDLPEGWSGPSVGS